MRLDDASKAVRRIATQNWDPETFRASVASAIAEALRALTLARGEVLRGVEIREASAGRTALRQYVAELAAFDPLNDAEMMYLVVPLPLDPERIDPTWSTDDFRIRINRLALELQMQNRRFRDWLIVAPSSSYATRDHNHVDFRVNVEGGTLAAAIRVFNSGALAFRRPAHSWTSPKDYSLNTVTADLEATLLFARNFLSEIGASPVQIATQAILRNMNDYIMSVPHDILGHQYGKPISAAANACYPEDALVTAYSDFVRDPLSVVVAIKEDLRSRYSNYNDPPR